MSYPEGRVDSPRTQLFLLSPAYCGGRRAGMLLRPGATMTLAQRLREGTLTLGEAFAFMSGLYFRGKLAYANRFGHIGSLVEAAAKAKNKSRAGVSFGSALVITPTRGLMSPETAVSRALLEEFASVDVDAGDRRYRRPLDRDLRVLAAAVPNDGRVILLGSIATGKYVDALQAALGNRLFFPGDFVGRGDMSRGGLLLRCVSSGVELEYSRLRPETPRHGARPPKLAPLPRAS